MDLHKKREIEGEIYLHRESGFVECSAAALGVSLSAEVDRRLKTVTFEGAGSRNEILMKLQQDFTEPFVSDFIFLISLRALDLSTTK